MSRNMRYFKHVMKSTGNTIKGKASGFFASLFHKDQGTTEGYKEETPTHMGAAQKPGRGVVARRMPVAGETAKVAAVRGYITAGRPERGATEKKRGSYGFARMANPRRFAAIITAAVVAVMVPVIAVSANAGADNSLPLLDSESNMTQAGKPENKSGLNLLGEIVREDGEEAQQGEEAQTADTVAGTEAPEAVQQPGETPQYTGADAQAAAPVCDDEITGEQVAAGAENLQEADAAEQVQPGAELQAEPAKQYLDVTPDQESPDVEKLQQRLMDLYYMEVDEPTELYGQQTQLAIKYFQRKHYLKEDGVAGEVTQELLFSDEAKPYSVTTEAEGPDVELLQERLQDLGYKVSVTGYFGTETEAAVKYFQRMSGLDDDGSVGQYTKEVMFSDEAEPSVEYWEEQDAREESSSSSESNATEKKEKKKSSSGGGSTSHVANPGNAQAFVDAAVAQAGKPYVRGGKGPDNFDCSGLVYYALNASGNSVGYMTSGGWASSGYPTVSSIGDLQVGDVICFTGHVGVYMGGGTMVDASSSKGQVVIRGLGNWAHSNFICGKRPL